MERFLDYFKPEYYWLELCIFRKKRLIRGTAIINGEIKSDCVKFHGANLDIKSVSFQPLYWTASHSDFEACHYEYDGQELKIKITSEMHKKLDEQAKINHDEDLDDRQKASFQIEYEAPIGSSMEGCYLSTYDFNGQKQEIITTQFESHYARMAFPCIDEPEAKAEFQLVLIIPDITPSDVVLANMPLASKDQNRYTFETTPRMSTYLLAWVIGPFKSVSAMSKHGVCVSSYCALNQSEESLLFANRTAVKALEYYDEKFGEAYPLPKLDQVALPDFEAGAMENWGLVTYRESMMLSDIDASLGTKRIVATTVTHELSHQWFGNLVTMKWWDDLWLNESFATIMEYYATDELYPELNIWEDFFTGDCLVALKRDALSGVQAVKQAVQHPAEIATLFDSAIVYAKGARLVLMLMRLMGTENFYKGLHHYFKSHAYKNTVGDDLWIALQPYADFDVRDFMYAWISQPGYPMLELSDSDEEHWQQQRFLIDGYGDNSEHWPLPDVKDDMSGHYLIKLSRADFDKKLSKFETLDLEQKLRLLIDRSLLAKAGAVESSDLLELIPKFSAETSATVWEILAGIINDLKLFCPPETTVAKHYKHFLCKILAEELKNIDLGPLSDSNQLVLRNLWLGLAHYVEDQPTLKRLTELYNPNLLEIDAELRSHILGAKLYYDELEVFAEWLKLYQEINNPDLKHILLSELAGYSKEPKHHQHMLELLNHTDIVRPQDHIYLFIFLLRNYRTRKQTIKWLTENWQFLEKLTGDKSLEDYPRYASNMIRTPEEAKIFFDFFDSKKDIPLLQRTLKIARVEIDARLELIKTEQPKIKRALERLLTEE